MAGLGSGDPHSSGRRAQQRLDGVEIAQYAAEFAGRLAELVALPRAAVGGGGPLFPGVHAGAGMARRGRRRAGRTAGPLAHVPIVFCEARPLAEEWTSRFLAAAHARVATEVAATERLTPLTAAGAATELAAAAALPEPFTAEVRAWARATGRAVSGRGKLCPEIWAAWRTVHYG